MAKSKYVQFKTQQVECLISKNCYIIDCCNCENRILLCNKFKGLCDVENKQCKESRKIKPDDTIANIDDGVDIEKERNIDHG